VRHPPQRNVVARPPEQRIPISKRLLAYISHLQQAMNSGSRCRRRAFLLTCLAPITAAVAVPLRLDAFDQSPSRGSRTRDARRRKRRQLGLATFYGREFTGDRTANGTRYDPNAMTAAHRTWPFGTVVRVTELETGRSVQVTITDRGPFGRNRRKGAVIDLSRAAARQLRMVDEGVMRVRLDVVSWGSDKTADRQPR
jgi:rare lipoprotein A